MTSRVGSIRSVGEKHYAAIRATAKQRVEVRLHAARSKGEAREIAVWIGGLVDALVEGDRAELARNIIKQAAAAKTKVGRKNVERVVAGVVDGSMIPKTVTVKAFGDRWINGELSRVYPDHVRVKDWSDDKSRLVEYIYPVIGSIPLSALGIADCERVMAKLPPELAPATRRHVAQILHRILRLAVFPARVLNASPLPPGFLPPLRKANAKAKAFLYPDEDKRLVSCDEVPLVERLAFGVMVREGARVEELLNSDWWQWDLARGMFSLDENKTADPRIWALRPDTVRSMTAWKKLHGAASGPFAMLPGDRTHLADKLRARLQKAGVTRAELFATTKTRIKIRAHDLRATFVTLALASGKSETWVSDRTGHKSSDMINRYRRQARQVAELGMGYDDLVELDVALKIPAASEAHPDGWRKDGRGPEEAAASSSAPSDPETESFQEVPKEGLEPSRVVARRILNPTGAIEERRTGQIDSDHGGVGPSSIRHIRQKSATPNALEPESGVDLDFTEDSLWSTGQIDAEKSRLGLDSGEWSRKETDRASGVLMGLVASREAAASRKGRAS